VRAGQLDTDHLIDTIFAQRARELDDIGHEHVVRHGHDDTLALEALSTKHLGDMMCIRSGERSFTIVSRDRHCGEQLVAARSAAQLRCADELPTDVDADRRAD
jgi:hypothetical protein